MRRMVAGFTLVELVLVIILLSILAAAALPRFLKAPPVSLPAPFEAAERACVNSPTEASGAPSPARAPDFSGTVC